MGRLTFYNGARSVKNRLHLDQLANVAVARGYALTLLLDARDFVLSLLVLDDLLLSALQLELFFTRRGARIGTVLASLLGLHNGRRSNHRHQLAIRFGATGPSAHALLIQTLDRVVVVKGHRALLDCCLHRLLQIITEIRLSQFYKMLGLNVNLLFDSTLRCFSYD